MLFLIISVPLSVLCAYLAFLAFRVKHHRVAISLSVVSFVSTLFSLGLIGGFHYLYTALTMQ
ncbi:MAG: hypothetical protein C0615_00185 [Desulfuromonas sp.]|nr:MAG: hypothetical protein C0615_00185 [Desulfuromonas sp.]